MLEEAKKNDIYFISAGEISGDIHAANLMNKIKEIDPSITFAGLGGINMKHAGLYNISDDISIYSTVGFTDSLRFYNLKLNAFKKSLKFIENNRERISKIILVDNQGFNILLAEKAKKYKIKIIYYLAPHVYIWGRWNAKKLSRLCDCIITSYDFDYNIYKKYTNNVFYPGNPVFDYVKSFKPSEDFLEKHNLSKSDKYISIFPGSRYQELETLLDIMIEVGYKIFNTYNYKTLIPISHPVYKDIILKKTEKYKDFITPIQNNSYEIIYNSEICIMSSGTATLEAVLFNKPVIICYKISPISYLIGKFLVSKKMIGIPNILLDKKIFPELLQDECSVNQIFSSFEKIEKKLNSDEYENYFNEIKKRMGDGNSIEKTAKLIYDL